MVTTPVNAPIRLTQPFPADFQQWHDKRRKEIDQCGLENIEFWLVPNGYAHCSDITRSHPHGFAQETFNGSLVLLVDTTPLAYVSAAEAKTAIELALSSRPRAKDVVVTITHETENEFLLHVVLTAPSMLFRIPLLWRLIGEIPYRPQRFSFDFAGHRHCQTSQGVVATSNCADTPADGPPFYCIWRIVDCDYLWNGHSFKRAIKRIEGLV